jgi:hypothetical protein
VEPADTPKGVPPEFAIACGAPGAEVNTQRDLVVIAKRDCDLTGVTISNGRESIVVPVSGGTGSELGTSVSWDAHDRLTYTTRVETAPPHPVAEKSLYAPPAGP